jgi:uncharacterized protein
MSKSVLEVLNDKDLCHPPKWLPANLHYAVITGSVAYAVSGDTSDMDVYGFCLPPKELVFPHLSGEIPGFGKQVQRFEQYQEHHVKDLSSDKEYDFTIYSIVKFFQLCMENNPNMVDTLFVPQRCVLQCSRIGQAVRDNRKMFLHKGSYHKFRGYMFAQMHKIASKTNSTNEKRKKSIEDFGFDVKFAYHVVRLGLECEQILLEGDLDLERNKEVLKSIRRGEWTLERIQEWATQKERQLDELYQKSTLRHSPDEQFLKSLLMSSLEDHYGSISQAVQVGVSPEQMINELRSVLDKFSPVVK